MNQMTQSRLVQQEAREKRRQQWLERVGKVNAEQMAREVAEMDLKKIKEMAHERAREKSQ